MLYYCLSFFIIVGGIHTVLRSKAGVTTSELGDHYCMIGPYHEPTVRLEVETSEPDLSVTREVIECMKKEGINVSLCYGNNYTCACITLLHIKVCDLEY